MFKPDFLITPFKLVEDRTLTPKDREVYAVVYWFQHLKDGKCTAGNDTIGEILGTDGRVVRRSLEMLEQRGYVVRTYRDEARKFREEIRALVSFRVGQDSPTLWGDGRTGRSYDVGQGSPQISNISKSNNTAPAKPGAPFVWKEYLDGMFEDKRGAVQVIAFYFQERRVRFDTAEQARVAIRRHLKAATEVSKFPEEKVKRAMKIAQEEYAKIFTIETLLKILTK